MPESGQGGTAPRRRTRGTPPRERSAWNGPRAWRTALAPDRARPCPGMRVTRTSIKREWTPTGGSLAPHGARPVHGTTVVRRSGSRLAGGRRRLCVRPGQGFFDRDLGVTIYGITVVSPNGRFLYLWPGRSFSPAPARALWTAGPAAGRRTVSASRKIFVLTWLLPGRAALGSMFAPPRMFPAPAPDPCPPRHGGSLVPAFRRRSATRRPATEHARGQAARSRTPVTKPRHEGPSRKPVRPTSRHGVRPFGMSPRTQHRRSSGQGRGGGRVGAPHPNPEPARSRGAAGRPVSAPGTPTARAAWGRCRR